MSRWDEGTLDLAWSILLLIVAVIAGVGVVILESIWMGFLAVFGIAGLWGGFEVIGDFPRDRD